VSLWASDEADDQNLQLNRTETSSNLTPDPRRWKARGLFYLSWLRLEMARLR
jgi:hypothetical protein